MFKGDDDIPGTELDAHNPLAIRVRAIIERGVEFHEKIWSDDEKFWKAWEKHPLRFEERRKSFAQFFSKISPPRVADNKPERGITPDKLEEAELTDDQLKKIAFGGNGE